MPVSREDCQAMLDSSAKKYGDRWIISGSIYGREAAMDIAELCLRSGRELTAVISSDWALSVARRLDALEEQMNAVFRPQGGGR
jgi:hypothetical protein